MSMLEFRAIERIIATLTGALLVYLGYRLFVHLPERTDSDGKFILPGNISIYMSRVGPGAFFALFGTCIVIASFYFSLTIQSQNGESDKGSGTISYWGGSGASLDENRANVAGDIFLLNQFCAAMKLNPSSIDREEFDQEIVRIKLALIWTVWGDNGDWGNYQEFRKWIEAGDYQSLADEFKEAFTLVNQGLN